jgi:putative N-acetyltransferase (TIGR04045 family)
MPIVPHDPFAPFVPPRFGIATAREPWERDAYHRLRRLVFCEEQRLFAHDDRDALDDDAQPIVAVTYVMGMTDAIVGTVRIHEHAPRRWTGSRLAIHPAYRGIHGLAAALIHRAVATAATAGCEEFTAMVQVQNVPLFRKLGWSALAERALHGRPHAHMRADLRAYPPLAHAARATILAS